jgi:hypothetical protein
VEDEYLEVDEYDEMLADPNGFSVKKLWPRISHTLPPISGLAQMLGRDRLARRYTNYSREIKNR